MASLQVYQATKNRQSVVSIVRAVMSWVAEKFTVPIQEDHIRAYQLAQSQQMMNIAPGASRLVVFARIDRYNNEV